MYLFSLFNLFHYYFSLVTGTVIILIYQTLVMTIISLLFVTFVSGNGYYIPNANEQGLNVKISLQTSRDNRGRKDTSARYATAWLDHGVNPTNKGYEYAIIVGTKPSTIRVNM